VKQIPQRAERYRYKEQRKRGQQRGERCKHSQKLPKKKASGFQKGLNGRPELNEKLQEEVPVCHAGVERKRNKIDCCVRGWGDSIVPSGLRRAGHLDNIPARTLGGTDIGAFLRESRTNRGDYRSRRVPLSINNHWAITNVSRGAGS